MPHWLNLPNLFTFLRLASVPFVVQATLAGDHARALTILLLAGFTDVLDGAAARRWGAGTQVGAYFDPIADKCLLCGVFLALAAARIVPWWFVALVLLRDLCILGAVAILMATTPHRRFPPSLWGKASTFFQIAAALAWMVRNAMPSPPLDAAATVLLWVSAALTLVSGADYALRGTRMLRPR
jgi:cardiolipin synthase (CMP-forming)